MSTEDSNRRAPTEAVPSISPEHHHNSTTRSLYIRTSFSSRIDVC
jgi:hypothetical protein